MTIANSIFTGTMGGLILHALYAMLSQNAVFGRGLGSSRLTVLVNDEDGDAGVFCVLLLVVQVFSGVLSWFASRWVLPLLGDVRLHFRPLVLVLCVCAVFFGVFLVVVQLFPTESAKRVVRQLPIAAFNCSVLGTLMLMGNQGYGLAQTVAFSVGSALGYIAALLLMIEGNRKLKKADLPDGFRGLPATLVYLGILSLLIYAFTGHGLSV